MANYNYTTFTYHGGTTSASTNSARYCASYGCMCPLATDWGYCKFTACLVRSPVMSEQRQEYTTAMAFPDTVDEFMEQYKIVDTDQVYTNGSELIPIFRMKQWFEHLQEDKT